ncbi:uncharacterized protein LOC125475130 [Pyrus x bretschneideri]|uniref:uncharacterized protein LOC125475130 n=1 Tax=Pyrus x bretschneideri TaxID=225117 RepID=UPI00202ED9DF|nr:uncharacterized protein LOC125475130 [Pyrus x bretschneideri]
MAESDRDHCKFDMLDKNVDFLHFIAIRTPLPRKKESPRLHPPHATIEEVVVMSSHERLHELLDRTPASNTLASSSISTPTSEMDITMILVGSNCFPTDIGLMILAILEQLEQSDPTQKPMIWPKT